ncbi:MAG TPA: glycine cleavage system aminomethyltransferase GcvT [Caulobacteraceae bacterium]|jgi:aminomethyltransferase|nr:glycine cleavage system aminomethyltransferase GcvT [Caulobacteraceae bacterium]
MSPTERLLKTPLHAGHKLLGGRMVAFAGYDMPVQYPDGVLAEHRWTRARAGLFDVSHMGPAWLSLTDRPGDTELAHQAISALLEPLICGDIAGLAPGGLRYTLLLNRDGGVIDDLMVGRPVAGDAQGSVYLVVNAGTKEADFAHILAALGGRVRLTRADDGGLIALQGPEAAAVMADLCPAALTMAFMRFRTFEVDGHSLVVSRSGYTGEDGFEILVPPAGAEALWERLLADERVRPIGLGARDSLRLEAGLPLYGHDLDETVSPIEAGLGFAVGKRRRAAGDFPGAARILRELAGDLTRVRVGLRVLEGAPAREGAEIVHDGLAVGRVTSGGFSPSLSAPIAMGFVPPALAAAGTRLSVVVRGKAQAAEVVSLPFVPHAYVRQP